MFFQFAPKLCPVCCEGENFKFIRNYQNNSEKFSLFECVVCQVQFWMPFKTRGVNWYEKSNEYNLKKILTPEIYKGYHKKFLKMYRDLIKGKKVLDLGCGTGEFIAELQKRGFKAWGVDFDKNAIEIAKKYFNLENVYAMSFDDFFQKKELPRFDIITFFEVIEHLDNPLKFIQNIKKILKPDGKIILSTPSRERFLANLAGWDFPPHHLTRWNKEAISNLFQKINFSVSYVDFIDHFKLLAAAINEKFRLRLVSKTAEIFKESSKAPFFVKFVHFWAFLKEYLLGTIPAAFLWVIGKAIKLNGGTMLIELESNNL